MDTAVRPARGLSWRRIGFLTLGIVAALAYVTGDTLVRSVAICAWNVLALAAVGLRAAREVKGHYWRRLFVAFAVYTLFNCTYFMVPGLTGSSLTFPSVADFGLFASYLLYGIVLVRIGMTGGPATRNNLDVVIVTAALSVPLWEFVVRASLLGGGPPLVSLTTLTYPVMLTVLFALVLRVVFLGRLPVASGLLLLGWVSGEFGADIYISVSTANGSFEALSTWFLLLLGSYACLGALALRRPLESSGGPKQGPSGAYGRLALLGGSLLVPVVSMAVVGTDRRPLYALGMAGALVVTIMVRLSMVTVNLAEQRDLLAEMKLLSTDLAHQALHDSLTGLPNRVLLADRIDNALAQPVTRANRGVAMLLLDLDRFKTVNDTYGHQTGDQMLVAVAACLREACRDGDTLARFGGDEFAVVLPDADLAEALRVADRISHSLLSPIPVGELTFVPSASIGIVVAEDQDRTALIRYADIAMYAAKAKGTGATAVFNSELHAQVVARHQMEIDLRGAAARGELVLEYQPVLSLAEECSVIDEIGDSALATAIVKLATSLGRRTQAEGIEYGEQLAHLRALNCELGQGYLFDRPLSADTISERIHSAELS